MGARRTTLEPSVRSAVLSQLTAVGTSCGPEYGAPMRQADQDTQHALVGDDLGGVLAQPLLIALGDQRRQRFVHRAHQQPRAQLHVGAKPLGQQPVNVRQPK